MGDERRHAKLSASSSTRWIACPPSVKLCERYPDKGSDYAAEGTAAHSLCEAKLKAAMGIPTAGTTLESGYYNEEMEECASAYAGFILEIYEREQTLGHHPQLFIEQRVDLSKYVKDGFGTCDAIIISDETLFVVDFKFGKGVKVDAANNSQLRLYALGALDCFEMLYDIKTVSMTIYQPRLEHISEDVVTAEDLTRWADEVLKPAAELAYNGEGEYKAGDHCIFCRAKHECRARAEQAMEAAKSDFVRPPVLEDDEIESLLGKLDGFISWANDIKEYALQSALAGKKWSGYKLVAGRSRRTITDEAAAARKLKRAGYKDIYKPKEMLGITALEKMCGADNFTTILGALIVKPQGKPALVHESDKREAINVNTAMDDFADPENKGD